MFSLDALVRSVVVGHDDKSAGLVREVRMVASAVCCIASVQ